MENVRNDKAQDCTHTDGTLFEEFEKPTYDEWKEAAVKLLKGKPFEKAMFTKTAEGITLEPIYNQDSLEALPHTDSLPGFAPYVRGTRVSGNLNEPWLVCQEVYAGHPKKFNEILVHDLFRGQTAFNMALDKPTMSGMDADDSSSEAVGVRGVSLSTLDDVSVALHDLVLEVLPVHINVGDNPLPITALFAAYLDKEHQNLEKFQGVLGYDPLGQLAQNGKLSVDLNSAYDFMSNALSWVQDSKSSLRTILIEGHPYHNGGADSVQELTYMMATGAQYLREMIDRGHTVNQVAPHMAFSMSLGSNFFMEISKIRAARMLWSKIVEAFGGDEESQKIYIHGKTSSWTKTVYDPYVGLLRNASEAFSGAVGGIDSLTVIPFDEPVKEADGFSRRISRNVQSILQEECHFTQPIDPAGGSWYIESLTGQIAENVWGQFQKIEAEGGMEESLKRQNPQNSVSDKYEEKFKNMAKRKHVWVGVNMYANMSEKKMESPKIDNEGLKAQRKKEVEDYKKTKDVSQKEEALKAMGAEKNALGKYSLAQAIKAVFAGATLGDLHSVTKESVTGEVSVDSVLKQRGAQRFEVLRETTEMMKEKGQAPTVFLFNIGPIPQHKPRADFSRGFFEVGAFEVISNNGYTEVDDLVNAGLQSNAHVGVICSTDATYPEYVPEIAKRVKAQKPNMRLVVAGRPPKDLESVYREAGIDDFIYMGADCYTLLKKIQEEVENCG